MASSSNDGSALEITLVDIGGHEITKGTWHGHCKAHELFQAAYKSKPGFLCKLLHGSEDLSPQSDLASLGQSSGHLTVVWIKAGGQEKQFDTTHRSHAFAAVRSDGSVVTWGQARGGGDSSRVEHRLQE
ncbi:unnamed protein product, partial [Polarella glacialis]